MIDLRAEGFNFSAVYKVEYAVASQSVTVSAGGVVTSNIASKEAVSSLVCSCQSRPDSVCSSRLRLSFGKLVTLMERLEGS